MTFYRHSYALLTLLIALPVRAELVSTLMGDNIFQVKSYITNVDSYNRSNILNPDSSEKMTNYIVTLNENVKPDLFDANTNAIHLGTQSQSMSELTNEQLPTQTLFTSLFIKFESYLTQISNHRFSARDLQFFYSNGPVALTRLSLILLLLTLIFLTWSGLQQRKSKKSQQQIITENLNESQKDLIYFLGEVIEYRSGETGQHVKRVAKISAKLARLRGLSEYQANAVKIVSPLHDVGKIAIPEAILNKPAKLTDEEFAIIQSHTTIGYKMLRSNQSPYMKLAAKIAHEHHEHWDGNGYPCGKKGEEIDILSRITAVADVFDALLSKRCYKEPWPLDKVIELFKKESGKQFDPELATLLVENIDEFSELIQQYSDNNCDSAHAPFNDEIQDNAARNV